MNFIDIISKNLYEKKHIDQQTYKTIKTHNYELIDRKNFYTYNLIKHRNYRCTKCKSYIRLSFIRESIYKIKFESMLLSIDSKIECSKAVMKLACE